MAEKKTAAEIIDAMAEPRGPITVTTRYGDMAFRRPADITEFTNLGAAARKFAQKLAKGVGIPESWAEYTGLDEEGYLAVYWVSALSIEPLTQLACLKAAHCDNAAAFKGLYTQVQVALAQDLIAEEVQELDDLGEGSEPTSSGE